MKVLLCLLLAVAPVHAQTYPELTGMFSHAAGITSNGLQWAWQHEGESANCSGLYLNAGTWFDWRTGVYERFCVEGDWVVLKGWGNPTTFLTLRTEDGRIGQKYARVQSAETYSFTETVELLNGAEVVGKYTDTQVWAPVSGGWSQTETFRYHYDIGAGCQFTATQTILPRTLFSSAYQTFISWAGGVIHAPPVRSLSTWTW